MIAPDVFGRFALAQVAVLLTWIAGRQAGSLVAAGFLGGIKGGVGAADEFHGIDIDGAGERCDADAGGDPALVACPMRNAKVGKVRAEGVGDEQGAVLVGIGQDDHELLATIAGGKVGGALQGVLEAPGQRFQHLVAGLMAIVVVIGLEVVDIEEQQAQGRTGAPVPRQFLFEGNVEGPPVGDAGQAVGRRQKLELFGHRQQIFLGLLQQGDVGDDDQGGAIGKRRGLDVGAAIIVQRHLPFARHFEAAHDPLDPEGFLSDRNILLLVLGGGGFEQFPKLMPGRRSAAVSGKNCR